MAMTTRSCGLLIFLLASIFSVSVRAGATAPSYSVSVGSGSFSPNPICSGMTATSKLSATLNVQNPNQEIQESGDSWGWSPSVTGYAASSQAAFGAVPSGVIPPSVGASSGSATSTVTAAASQTTSPGYYQVTVTATDSFTLTDSTTSPATVTPQSQSGSTTLQITVVVVGDIQYNDPNNGWVSVPSDFIAMEGTTSPVRAIPNPSDASFPSGQLVWGGIASGTGTTATATFSTDSTNIGDETISVTLGSAMSQSASTAHFASANTATSTSQKVSKPATTFKLTPKLRPVVTFPNRSVISFGVGEAVSLDFDVIPIGTPMPETVWSLSGDGQLQDNGAVGEIGYYWAGVDPGNATFTFAVTTGPSKGKSVKSPAITIVTPNPAIEVRDPKYGDFHINAVDASGQQGDAGAGFEGIISLLPKTVSFTRVQFGEVNCVASSGTGDLSGAISEPHIKNTPLGQAKYNDIAIDPTYGNTTIAPPGPNYGTLTEDGVGFDISPNDKTGQWIAGDATYKIPWVYRVYNLDQTKTADRQILIMPQVLHIGSDGSATITKSQGSSSRQLLDPTNNFLNY